MRCVVCEKDVPNDKLETVMFGYDAWLACKGPCADELKRSTSHKDNDDYEETAWKAEDKGDTK